MQATEITELAGFEEAWNAPLTLPAGYQPPVYPDPPGFEEAWNAPSAAAPARAGFDPDCVYCVHGVYSCEHMVAAAD